jgi:hypothetical protein
MGTLATMRHHLEGLRKAASSVAPTQLSGPDAAAVVELGAEVERMGAALRTRFCLRVTRTGAFEGTGHKSAASWLAEVSGEPVGRAMGVLETAGHLEEAPEVAAAFQEGRLSLVQAGLAAAAGAMDPGAQGDLVRSATSGESYKDLKDKVARIKRRKQGEAAIAEREARAQMGRYLRTFQPEEGGLRLEAWLTTADGAKVKAALDKEADAVFHEARKAGHRESPERYLADALVKVVTGERAGGPPAQVALRVDAGALTRGEVEGDEVCEVVGVGPVPVEVAKSFLSDALVHLVVTDGVDIKAVTSAKRTIPATLRAALQERDRTCAVPGCTATKHLEIDHLVDFAKGGATELENTVRLCKPHHDMKTYQGFRLLGKPGGWRWVGPGNRGSPG